jgi:hypothetical protein
MASELNAIIAAFEAVDIELLDHDAPGVRFKPKKGKRRK